MYRKHADSGRSSFMVMHVGSDFRLQAVRTQDTTTTTLLLLLLLRLLLVVPLRERWLT
jgi:hypothetical protein